jgi:pSer/pThr/pTyr-binding forkhead associated (FHA) protein
MLLCYNLPNGEEKKVKLEKSKITLGRGLNVDLTIQDRLASRLHCVIEFKNNAWHITDLKSRNGTYLNGERIQEARLNIGDRIRIGEKVLVCERAAVKGTETVIRELQNEMDSGGKGFKTMMIEIVGNGKKNRKSSTDKISP